MSCTSASCAARTHSLVGAARLEPGDVVGDRAVEQVDVLRQIADRRAAVLGRILVERSAVERDLAARQRPDAGDRPRQRGLARSGRPDDAEPVARFNGKADAGNGRHASAGRRDEAAVDFQPRARRGQARLRLMARVCRKRPLEARRGQACGDELPPLRDRDVDRRKRARSEDRGRDDRTGGNLLLDREICGQAPAPAIAAACAAHARRR